jgi:hypothetical protein
VPEQNGLKKANARALLACFLKWLLGLFDVRARYRQPSRQSEHEAV